MEWPSLHIGLNYFVSDWEKLYETVVRKLAESFDLRIGRTRKRFPDAGLLLAVKHIACT